MQINVKGKNLELTDALKSHADTKVKKISRYSDAVINADVTLTLERNWHIAKVNLFGKGFDMHAEEKSKDMYNSIDRVVEKLERDLKRQREKETSHRAHRGGDEVAAAPAGHSPKDIDDHYGTHVESVSRFLPPTMTADAAVKELESSGYQFFCFSAEEDGVFTIVHKSAGGYRVLKPILEA